MINFTKKQRRKTVFVGLSGGVDSSVAAKRLIREGYDVIGVFIKVWQPDFLDCDWEKERLDAMRVAAQLNISFLTCDAASTYKKEVADYFISEYLAGRTPNPDVMCNQSIKFGTFLDFALAAGADYVATGHYARIESKNNDFLLYRGQDTNKDQSYFLWTLTKKQRQHILLPVGDTTKDEIRHEATVAMLPTAKKKDSQGVCFLGHIDIPEFLSHFTTLEPGVVLDEEGNSVGTHKGALVYTLGQRHGFSVDNKASTANPKYVVAKDLTKNTITIGDTPPQITQSSIIKLKNTNWIGSVDTKFEALAQFRYRQNPIPVKVIVNDTGAEVEPLVKTERPALGQSCVIYQNDLCLGGGIIES